MGHDNHVPNGAGSIRRHACVYLVLRPADNLPSSGVAELTGNKIPPCETDSGMPGVHLNKCIKAADLDTVVDWQTGWKV